MPTPEDTMHMPSQAMVDGDTRWTVPHAYACEGDERPAQYRHMPVRARYAQLTQCTQIAYAIRDNPIKQMVVSPLDTTPHLPRDAGSSQETQHSATTPAALLK